MVAPTTMRPSREELEIPPEVAVIVLVDSRNLEVDPAPGHGHDGGEVAEIGAARPENGEGGLPRGRPLLEKQILAAVLQPDLVTLEEGIHGDEVLVDLPLEIEFGEEIGTREDEMEPHLALAGATTCGVDPHQGLGHGVDLVQGLGLHREEKLDGLLAVVGEAEPPILRRDQGGRIAHLAHLAVASLQGELLGSFVAGFVVAVRRHGRRIGELHRRGEGDRFGGEGELGENGGLQRPCTMIVLVLLHGCGDGGGVLPLLHEFRRDPLLGRKALFGRALAGGEIAGGSRMTTLRGRNGVDGRLRVSPRIAVEGGRLGQGEPRGRSGRPDAGEPCSALRLASAFRADDGGQHDRRPETENPRKDPLPPLPPEEPRHGLTSFTR